MEEHNTTYEMVLSKRSNLNLLDMQLPDDSNCRDKGCMKRHYSDAITKVLTRGDSEGQITWVFFFFKKQIEIRKKEGNYQLRD